MAYTPPDPTALEFALTTPYTAPDPTALAFELGAQTVEFSVTGVTAYGLVGDVTTIQRTDQTVSVTGEYAAAQLGVPDRVAVSHSHNVVGVAATAQLGTATVTGTSSALYIEPDSSDSWGGTVSWIGVATFTNVDQYIDVTGVGATGAVGSEYAYGNIIRGAGVSSLICGRYYAGPDLQMIWDYGVDQLQIGNRTYVFDGSLSWVYGSEHSEIGAARLFNSTLRSMGEMHSVISELSFISNLNRTYAQSGEIYLQVGAALVDNQLRVVQPSGQDFSVVAFDYSMPNELTGIAPGVHHSSEYPIIHSVGEDWFALGYAWASHDGQLAFTCGHMDTAEFGVSSIRQQ